MNTALIARLGTSRAAKHLSIYAFGAMSLGVLRSTRRTVEAGFELLDRFGVKPRAVPDVAVAHCARCGYEFRDVIPVTCPHCGYNAGDQAGAPYATTDGQPVDVPPPPPPPAE